MPHADSCIVPPDVASKAEFYSFLQEQLLALIEGSHNWVSNLAQASSLLYFAYLSSPFYGLHPHSDHKPVVNWVGVYYHPTTPAPIPNTPLILGPFIGRPACISLVPTAGKGVCADAFISGKGLVVDDVDVYPGHIACDGDTVSEIVIPIIVPTSPDSLSTRKLGVLDLDSTVKRTFDQDDLIGLTEIVRILVSGSHWD